MQVDQTDRIFELAERRFDAPAPGVKLPQRRKRKLRGVQIGEQQLPSFRCKRTILAEKS